MNQRTSSPLPHSTSFTSSSSDTTQHLHTRSPSPPSSYSPSSSASSVVSTPSPSTANTTTTTTSPLLAPSSLHDKCPLKKQICQGEEEQDKGKKENNSSKDSSMPMAMSSPALTGHSDQDRTGRCFRDRGMITASNDGAFGPDSVPSDHQHPLQQHFHQQPIMTHPISSRDTTMVMAMVMVHGDSNDRCVFSKK